MKIVPLGDRVLIKKDRIEKVGAIVIPEEYQRYTDYAEVVFVSEEVTRVKAGDKVLVGKYTGTVFEIDGVEMILIRAEDIIGKVYA